MTSSSPSTRMSPSSVEVVDVDERLGPGEAQLHHRQQAVPAGDEPGLGAVLLEQRERVVDAGGPFVLERRWYLHGVPLWRCGSRAVGVRAPTDRSV